MTPDQQFALAMLGIFVPSILTGATAVIFLVLNKRMKEYHDTVNSKMDKLLAAEKLVSRGEGVREGRAEQKQETVDSLAKEPPQPVIIVQDQPLDVKVVEPEEKEMR